MSVLTSPARFRRTAAGLALIAASLMFVAADVVRPSSSDDNAGYSRDVAANPDAFAAAGVLQVLGFSILVIGIVAIVHLIQGRGVTLAHIGGALALIGLGAFPALAMTGIVDSIAAETLGASAHATLIEGFEGSAAAAVVLLVSLAGALLGAVLIGAAVWRSRLGPWWVGVSIIAGTLLLAVPSSQALFLLGDVLHLIGFGYVGVRMLRMRDDDWEHPRADWGAVEPARPRAESQDEPVAARRLAEPAAR